MLGDDGGSGYKKAGFGVNAAVTVASVGGNLINPPTTPNTDQLEASQSGWQENKDDVNDAAKARGRNSNTGANRRPKGK